MVPFQLILWVPCPPRRQGAVTACNCPLQSPGAPLVGGLQAAPLAWFSWYLLLCLSLWLQPVPVDLTSSELYPCLWPWAPSLQLR